MTAPTVQSMTVRAHQHETLDALAWRQLGSTAGHVEATLAALCQRHTSQPICSNR